MVKMIVEEENGIYYNFENYRELKQIKPRYGKIM